MLRLFLYYDKLSGFRVILDILNRPNLCHYNTLNILKKTSINEHILVENSVQLGPAELIRRAVDIVNVIR